MNSLSREIVLTGIKPTGEPHIGNYLGAIRPSVELMENYDAYYFIADYHALNTVKDAHLLSEYIYSITASWLACGLDPNKALFYRQSAIAEVFELAIMLNAYTAKGLMNRAHAYKAAVEANINQQQPEDHHINMGLFCYPILMAADIMLFNANLVPVGRDQQQHVEMAQDIAESFNNTYKTEGLVRPMPYINEEEGVILGIDGRKMSKNYKNVIPLFCSNKQLKKLVNSIATNSQDISEVKDPATCTVFGLYKLFATEAEQAQLAARYRAGGMGWGEAKQTLYEKLDEVLTPIRDRYSELIVQKDLLDDILVTGATQAKVKAQAKMAQLREIIGI